MTATLRVGVIGLGWIGRDHLLDLRDRDDLEIVSVCDVAPALAETTAAQVGALAFTDNDAFFAESSIDALWICTPPQHHLAPAVEALQRGIPVYLEKPIARSVDDARELVRVAEDSGVVCAVGYQWHALDIVDTLQQELAGQRIAAVIGQSIGYTAPRPWFLQKSAGGGNLLERGSHHLDLARAFGGEVAAIQVTASKVQLERGDSPAADRDIDDVLTMLLRFVDGGTATIVVAWTHQDGPSIYSLDVIADRGAYRLTLDPEFRLAGVTDGRPVQADAGTAAFRRSNDRFLVALDAKDPAAVACTPRDALDTLVLATAGEKSLATGDWVHLR